MPTSTITYSKVPKPSVVNLHVSKPYNGAGYYAVSPRQPVGACEHRTAGLGQIEFIKQLFEGERLYDALTDYVIGLDGRIGELNDPFGTRSPWANGGSDGLEGDGPNFVKAYGISGINDRLVSIEHIGQAGTPFEGAQFESSAKLNAWIFDQAKVPWDQFPVNPASKVVTYLEHFEFATKGCPEWAFVNKTDAHQDRIRALMKQYQTGASVPVTQPRPDPVVVDHTTLPGGITVAKATEVFGRMPRIQNGETLDTQGFNAKGLISLAWLERAQKEKTWPAAAAWYVLDPVPGQVVDDREVVIFKNGWTLLSGPSRSTWTWAGEAA